MSRVVVKHTVSVAIARSTSEPVERAWCSCGWTYRCALGWQHAMDEAREHATLTTYTPPSRQVSGFGFRSPA